MGIDLERERLNRGLSLNGMADEVKIARGTLKRAEEGEAIHPASALKIAKFLGVQVTDIWPVDERAAAA